MICDVVAKMENNKNQSTIFFLNRVSSSITVDVTGVALQPALSSNAMTTYYYLRSEKRTTKYVCSGVILFFVNGGSTIAVVINRFLVLFLRR